MAKLETMEIEHKLAETIGNLRVELANRGMAFGALYVAVQKGGSMVILAETMPAHLRVKLLEELAETCHIMISEYRKES